MENTLLNAPEICTDATTVSTNGKQTYIRNFSTEKCVLYCNDRKKDLDTLANLPILSKYTGILTHDHETALYHFGTGHGECNVHLGRYLCKNRDKMAGGFRNASGREMYCRIMSFIETVKQRPEHLPKHYGSYGRRTNYTVTGLFVVS